MKLTSIAGIVSYAADIEKTAEFYESLGFIIQKRTANSVMVRLNWFWIDFRDQSTEEKPAFQAEATASHKGAGSYLYVKVDDVDVCYDEMIVKGLKPSSQPQDWPWGNREFVVRDPDGYKLVFFAPISKKR